MPTQREYERKFLLRRAPQNIDSRMPAFYIISQYYTEDGTRYRYQQGWEQKQTAYLKTIKTPTENPEVRIEREERITKEEYSKAVAGCSARISKRRYTIDKGFYEIVVDVFLDFTLVLAEMEIVTDMEEGGTTELLSSIQFPPFIQKEVLMEVTHLDQFKNQNLAKM